MMGSIQPKVANFKHLANECLIRMPNHVHRFESIVKRELPIYQSLEDESVDECIAKAFEAGVKRKVQSNCGCLLYDNCRICDCPLPPGYPYEESQVGIFR